MSATTTPAHTEPNPATPTTPTTTPAAAGPGPATQAPYLRRLRYEPLTGERLAEPVRSLPPPRRPAPARRPDPDPADRPPEDLRANVGTTLLLVLDVLDGRRPPWQLTSQLAPEAMRVVRSAGRRGNGRSRLTSLRICRPTPDAAEVAAVYQLDGRTRAVAARFERGTADPRWRCVAIRLG